MRPFAVVGATLVVLVALGWIGLRAWRGPTPEAILARLEIPPSPVLSPEQEQASFRLAPGFRIELVAAEPLVVDPVAMDWDDEGRLYVVEMRGFMGDIEGGGEEEPVGRVVVLEDRNGDGRMDESRVFLDGLVMPRAIAVLPEGVLIGVPPDLLLCRDVDADLHCAPDERQRVAAYAATPGNVEHHENRLLPALDGWLYNAKSDRRFRLIEASIKVEPTLFRGQWGLAQDDEGRLYYNHNSGFLYADLFPAEYALRQPLTSARLEKPGLNVDLAAGASVFGVRVAPGLNRAYQPGSLRPDGRQNGPTGVSGLEIQRGHQYGIDFVGDAFVPESAGAAVAHFRIEHDGLETRATHMLYDDEDWGEREFLASSDERFRPVDARVGPDGAIWLIDMYRGVIQHAEYVSDYLRDYVHDRSLEAPGATGRIWRVVREDRPIDYRPAPLGGRAELLAALDHPNGWVRDRAQRRLLAAPGDREPLFAALRELEGFSDAGRRHALWTLAGLGGLDEATWRAAIASDDPSTRRLGLRLAASAFDRDERALAAAAVALLADPDDGVRLQAVHTLGDLSPDRRPIAQLLEAARQGGAIERQAVLSSLAGLEAEALELELVQSVELGGAWLSDLAAAVYLAGQASKEPALAASEFFDRVAGHADAPAGQALLAGALEAQRQPGHLRVVLREPHPLFATGSEAPLEELLSRVRRGVTWPGDDRPGGARPLSPEEEVLRRRGAALFAETCATCHGEHGRGNKGLAPPLAGSSWVRDADDWLVRIALQGVRGPIEVNGETWNRVMPGHAHDPRFDDPTLAGLLTHLRRSWGHAERPVTTASVARIRAESAAHPEAWTAEELRALPIDHRLDRFTGIFRIPIVGIVFRIERAGPVLEVGRRSGGRAPLVELSEGVFAGQGLRIRFDAMGEGPLDEAEVSYGDRTFSISRVDGQAP